MPYWLGTRSALNLFRQTRIWQPADAALEAEMSAALLAFARHGVPASPALHRWPAFDAAAPRLVSLGEVSEVVNWPHFADIARFPASVTGTAPSGKPRD